MNKRQRLIGLMGGLLSIIIIFSFKGGGFLSASYLRGELELKQLNEKAIPLNIDSKFSKFNEGIIQLIEGDIIYYNYLGEEKWKVAIDVIDPVINTSQESVYIFDNIRKQLIRIDNKGNVVYRYTTEGRLNNFYVGKSDDNVIIYEEIENKGRVINIIDKNGRKKSTINISQGHVLNISLSKSNDVIALGILDIGKEELESHIFYYNLKGNFTNSVSLGSSIIYDMSFDKDGKLIVVTDLNITALSKDKIKWSVDLELVKSIKFVDNSSVVVNGHQSSKGPGIFQREGNMLIVQNNGKIIETDRLEQVIGINFYDKDIVVFSRRTIYILNNKGDIIFSHRYHKDIDEVYLFEKGHLTIVTKEKIYFNKLEKK